MKTYLISYDIVKNKNRYKIAKILEDYGDRVQYSVFEIITDRIEELKKRLLSKMDIETDSIRIYSLCADCRNNVEKMGDGTPEAFKEEDFYII